MGSLFYFGEIPVQKIFNEIPHFVRKDDYIKKDNPKRIVFFT